MNSIASLISKCAHDVSESKGIIQMISDFFDGNIMNIFTGVSAIIALIISITNFAYLYYMKKKCIFLKCTLELTIGHNYQFQLHKSES